MTNIEEKKKRREVAQSCPTLCDPMDGSPPGSSIHGIFQAWIPEWVAISFSRGSSWPRYWTWVSLIVGRCFTVQALKSRNITLQTKVRLVKAMVFPVVMYGCENWTVKKAERWRIDAFELWCWRRLLRVLGQQGEPTSPSWRKSVLNIHWKDWCWNWNSSILAT